MPFFCYPEFVNVGTIVGPSVDAFGAKQVFFPVAWNHFVGHCQGKAKATLLIDHSFVDIVDQLTSPVTFRAIVDVAASDEVSFDDWKEAIRASPQITNFRYESTIQLHDKLNN